MASIQLYGAVFALLYLSIRFFLSGKGPANGFARVGPKRALAGLNRLQTADDFLKNARAMISEGYQRYSKKNEPFFLESAMPPRLVIPPGYLDAIRNLPEEEISHRHTITERFMGRWTGLSTVAESTIHSHVCQKTLVQQLPRLLPKLYEQARATTAERFASDGGDGAGWTTISAAEAVFHIMASINSLVLVGPTLSDDDEWLAICRSYPQSVVTLAETLRIAPAWLRPLVYRFSQAGRTLRAQTVVAYAKLLPLIEARQAARARTAGEKPTGEAAAEPQDVLQWLISQSSAAERKPRVLCTKILFLTMASFHAPTMQAVYSLLGIAASQTLQVQLRHELEVVLGRKSVDGHVVGQQADCWTLKALAELRKLDSVLKETQRLYPPALLGVNRRVIRDLTMPDGTTIPRGTIVAAPIYHIAHDPSVWVDHDSFRPLRFFNEREKGRAAVESDEKKQAVVGKEDFKLQFATPDAGVLGFGFGRQACPGRIFAAVQLKLALGLILQRCELRPAQKKREQKDFEASLFFGETIVPNPQIEFEYRVISSVPA